jgi:predicted transcriptional regulator
MQDKMIKEILKKIKSNDDIIIVKDVASLNDKGQRYTQGFLDALEGVGFIELKSKGTMKIITLTKKGMDFLEDS